MNEPASVGLTHDIVCHNYFHIGPKTPKLDIANRQIYFCSKECLNIYMINPKNYPINGESEADNG